MAKATFLQRGEALDYVNSGAVTVEAGTVVVLGTKIGVTAADIAAGATGAVHVEGVFELPEKSGESAIAQGAAVYWNATAAAITATATNNTLAGYAAAGAGASAEKILVKINA
jgi:predicted RecA/RadA family phage recombinase